MKFVRNLTFLRMLPGHNQRLINLSNSVESISLIMRLLTHCQTHFLISRLSNLIESCIRKVLVTSLAMTCKACKFLVFMRIRIIVIKACSPKIISFLVSRVLSYLNLPLTRPASKHTASIEPSLTKSAGRA